MNTLIKRAGPLITSVFLRYGAIAAIGLCVFAMACRKTPKLAPDAQRLSFPSCESSTQTELDINGDGRADAVHVMRNNTRECSRFDFNFDGITDLIRVYSDGTNKKLEAFDHDRDGRVDSITHYRPDGSVEGLQMDMNFDQVMDVELQCADGFVSAAKRTRNQQGRIDTWETYDQGLLSEVKYDENADGKADRVDRYENGVLISMTRASKQPGKPDIVDEIPTGDRRTAQAPLRCEPTQIRGENANTSSAVSSSASATAASATLKSALNKTPTSP